MSAADYAARVRPAGWDPLVRIFHWSTVLLVLANFAVLDDESKAHEWAGYAVLALVAFRIVWGLIGTPSARFAAFPPSPRAALTHVRAMIDGRHPAYPSHNPVGALMVYNLLATLIAVGVSGWLMTTNAFWGTDWVEELHEALANWLMISAGLHVAGVLLEQYRSKTPLVRAMITGRRTAPGP